MREGEMVRNRGWFKKGEDARRHQFTDEERKRGGVNGYREALKRCAKVGDGWDMVSWLFRRVRGECRKRRREK